jgi:hypothetical protein
VGAWAGGLGGEMTQALYAHMNNKTIKKKNLIIECFVDTISVEVVPFYFHFDQVLLSNVDFYLSNAFS